MKNEIRILEVNNPKNSWTPPYISTKEMACSVRDDSSARQTDTFLHIFRIEPYIDSIYIRYDKYRDPIYIKRFTIHSGLSWDKEDEEFFQKYCVKSNRCTYSGGTLDRLFEYCTEVYPDWHVQRYRTKGLRMLDHIYNCVKRNTAKEMLYKAGLDELAVHVDEIDELDLLATKPSDLFGGLSMKVLRSLNCPDGAALIKEQSNRDYIIELNRAFPDLFSDRLNDAQCRYIQFLINGNLTVGETGRLFRSRKRDLYNVWHPSIFDVFMAEERRARSIESLYQRIGHLDPIYDRYIRSITDLTNDYNLKQLVFYIERHREEFDWKIRKSNRKRPDDWQERGDDFIVRYPQTIHDFCREAIYMQNCLMAYVEAMVKNDTTILFLRRSEEVNQPFITIEVYDGMLMQAYHRFNQDCTPEEAEWIRHYCERHNIAFNSFKFDADVDLLY